MRGVGPGVFSNDEVGTGSGSEGIVTMHSQLFQKCNHGMQQCSLSCGEQLDDWVSGSGAVVRGSQMSNVHLIVPVQYDQFSP